jgi:hypothetical protein
VIDEQRCHEPKSARLEEVAPGSPSDFVTPLGRATSPPRAAFLAEELPEAIRVGKIYCTPL